MALNEPESREMFCILANGLFCLHAFFFFAFVCFIRIISISISALILMKKCWMIIAAFVSFCIFSVAFFFRYLRWHWARYLLAKVCILTMKYWLMTNLTNSRKPRKQDCYSSGKKFDVVLVVSDNKQHVYSLLTMTVAAKCSNVSCFSLRRTK